MDQILSSTGILIFRLLYGVALIPHSFPKINRAGNKQMKGYMKQIGIHPAFVDLSMIIELLGGILVILGTLYILVGAVLVLFFLGTVVTSIAKMKKPLPSMTSPGYDLDILFLAGAILLLITGPGSFSILAGPSL
ncbi:DoxX family protein [Metallosphaera tengchongensis]|uniref:DoxX family protein n=1 Tax=Metallosphaera tengchongensis TaxID=1532350 RepID=A0A6N0NT86_9CREN|nr:DoxX family protein [Metallosphaera tengchongensis]QKR00064.1 DoxX family protein [Metallosphaera tengchongensis]